MKKQPARSIFLVFISLAFCVACRDIPEAIPTLAPAAPTLAGAGTETGRPTEATGQPTVPTESIAGAAQPSETPQPPPTDTPVPTPTPTPTPAPPPIDSYQIIKSYPHDPEAFTQGLVLDNNILYEGTGRWGQSSLRQVALESGLVLRSVPIEDQYFGEGITVFGDRIYQLTWQEGTGFIYDKNTFERLQTFNYPHEGWGITHDGQRLIVSDGTPIIRFWDPNTLQEIGQITVRDHTGPLNRLNELEYINGEIWANIWMTDRIARIDPETGSVKSYLDLTGLLDPSTLTQPVDVLNGIAYDASTGRLFVTGKLWPSLFEITVVPGS